MWKREPALLCQLAERGDFGSAIDQAIFGRVGDRDRRRLNLVHIVADAVASLVDRSGVNFAPVAVEQDRAWRRR